MLGLIDSHAHLTYDALFPQIGAVLERCAANGVAQIITVGTDLADARRAIELREQFPSRIHVAAAFHPHHAAKVTDADFQAMTELWPLDDVVAIGELGLDYHYDFADRRVQQAVLNRQLSTASRLDRPLIVHCREAFDDTLMILTDHGYQGRRVVFHCFTGTPVEARRVAEKGWRVSFTGIVTFKNSKELQAIAREYPSDQLMIETDSPYLSPVPVRGIHPNEPAHVAHVARFLAELRGDDLNDFCAATAQNTRSFFGLSQS